MRRDWIMAVDNIYEAVEGDTFDSIALQIYGDEFKASEIIKSNPDYIKNIIFSSGIKLKLPVIETPESSTLPPWKREDI
ncbi:tail protein X [Clostridium tyrobutyricum]|nr:tail protein X [Clostridium tyrobutyricum]